jgi:hypothetical protein
MKEVQSARYNEHGLRSNTKPPSVHLAHAFALPRQITVRAPAIRTSNYAT